MKSIQKSKWQNKMVTNYWNIQTIENNKLYRKKKSNTIKHIQSINKIQFLTTKQNQQKIFWV